MQRFIILKLAILHIEYFTFDANIFWKIQD